MAVSKFTATKKALFLKTYRLTGNVTRGAEAADIDRRTFYHWKDSDKKFTESAEDAENAYVDGLEVEADRRAHDGVEEPVFYQGVRCGTVRKYSDTLLMFRLNGLRPEKYKRVEKREISGRIDVCDVEIARAKVDKLLGRTPK